MIIFNSIKDSRKKLLQLKVVYREIVDHLLPLLCLEAVPHKIRAIPATNNQMEFADRYPGGADIPSNKEMIMSKLITNRIIPIAITNVLIKHLTPYYNNKALHLLRYLTMLYK